MRSPSDDIVFTHPVEVDAFTVYEELGEPGEHVDAICDETPRTEESLLDALVVAAHGGVAGLCNGVEACVIRYTQYLHTRQSI